MPYYHRQEWGKSASPRECIFTIRSFLLKNAYSKAEIEDLLSQTNFAKVNILEDTLGMDIWLEK